MAEATEQPYREDCYARDFVPCVFSPSRVDVMGSQSRTSNKTDGYENIHIIIPRSLLSGPTVPLLQVMPHLAAFATPSLAPASFSKATKEKKQSGEAQWISLIRNSTSPD